MSELGWTHTENRMNPIQIVEENAISYYQGIARLLGGEYQESDQVTWFVTGRRSLGRFNGVLHTAISRIEDIGKVVDPILKMFISQNLPFFWVDWAEIGTTGLGDYLVFKESALMKFSIPAMTRALDDLPQVSIPKEVEITRVQIQQDQADWLNVLMEGFEEPELSRPDFGEYLANSLSESNPVFEHFLARWQGKPCAISTLLRADHSAGIYHVTTLPNYRGHGLGKALTLASMHSARQWGYDTAVLFATPSGFPIYQRLGFETVSTADLYAWSGVG